VAWSPPLASLTPPALILATSSSNSLPHLAAAAFWWMGIGRMVGWGGRQRRELLIDRGTTRSKGGLNHHKNPLARSDQAGRPRPSGSVWARLSPRGSSWHFALGPLHLCHFEVVIPAIKVGVFLYEVRTLRLVLRDDPSYHLGLCHLWKWFHLALEHERNFSFAPLNLLWLRPFCPCFPAKTQHFPMHVRR
jgi:hypothetical protein